MKTRLMLAGVGFAVATAAFAHGGVKNPAVMARMDGMVAISENMKVLGMMAKGSTAFDISAVDGALAAISDHARDTPVLFAAQETDPKSEALPAIWAEFDDFSKIALELQTIASELQGTINSADQIGPALGQLGATCKSCHADYRK